MPAPVRPTNGASLNVSFSRCPAKNRLWCPLAAADRAPPNLSAYNADPRCRRRSMTSLETVRARFTSGQGLPFAEVLTEASILEVLDEHQVEYRDRVFGPLTTIWGFLSQVLSDDHSCRD